MTTNLRIRLKNGVHGVPLERVYRVAGYASLLRQAEGVDAPEYFLGWLKFQGQLVPVFDLNRVVCETPTPEAYGSRILIFPSADERVPLVGLLAPGVTDTTPADDQTTVLDLDMYLSMLGMLIPEVPAATR